MVTPHHIFRHGRHQCARKDERRDHGDHDGLRHGLKQIAGTAGEPEERQPGDRDAQGRDERRDDDLIGGVDDGLEARKHLAFYSSTPAYLPTLACHGWEGAHPELNRLSKLGRWDDMIDLIGDDILNEIAVVGERHEIAGKLRARLDGIADSVSITHNRYPDPHHWADVVKDFKHSA